MDFDLLDHTHLLVIAGSRAYGLDRPDSDVDLKGVCIPSAVWFHGLRGPFEQADEPDQIAPFQALLTPDEQAAADAQGLEGSVYGLRKFCRLAMDCNPHVLDTLFCDESAIRRITPIGRRLRDAAPTFLSVRARHSFGSYARSQLKRIEGHRRWLLEPPQGKPERADFDLPDHTLIPREQLQAAEAAIRKQVDRWELDLDGLEKAQQTAVRERIARTVAEIAGAEDRWSTAARFLGMDDNLVEVMKRERAYRSAMRQFKAFQRWQRERNPARAALEAAHGYDTKHASHLVRLLRMAVEILETGKVHVWRGDRDAEELRAIREGAWSYDQLLAFAEAQEARLRTLEREGVVAVPQRVDRHAVEALVQELVEAALGSVSP